MDSPGARNGRRLTKIRELRDGQSKVEVQGRVTEVSDSRTVNLRSGGQARVADCVLEDETGSIKLSLWNEQIDRVQVGSTVTVVNGYTNSFRGEIRLNVGRYGTLNVSEG